MTYKIDNHQCIDCRLCVPECPDGGISVKFDENGENGFYTIDSTKCTECIEFDKNSKCAYICPVDCIDNTEDKEPDELLWEKWKNNKN